MQQEGTFSKLRIDLIVPNPHQPRKIFNEESIDELANSIKEYGILNPILVRKKDNLYEIVAGERRYRAAKKIGLTEVPVIIKDIDELKTTEISIIENLQRENISPIEEAKSYQEILNSSDITEEKLSTILGKSQAYISNKLRLLKLPQNIQEAIGNHKISERHARSLLTIKDDKKQNELLNRVINEKLTVKELESIINDSTVNEQEIQSAINDIMKSLNIELELNEKKEEKESDNMNDGNFFPYQSNEQNNNMTLNNMNMQTMNNPAVSPAPETPQNNPMPEFVMPSATAPMEQPMVMPTPAPATPELPAMEVPTPIEQPLPEMAAPSPIPQFEVPTPMPENNLAAPNSMEQPIINPEIQPPIVDQPLFGENNQAEQPAVSPVTYEVPVMTETANKSKIEILEELLNNNNINYKKYSNENGNCIIIEI